MRVSDEEIRISREDNETVSIPAEAVRKVNLEVFKWSLAVISAVTVVFGAYFFIVENPLGGIIFAAVGVWSLYRTYRERNTLILWVDGRPKPVTVYPEDPKACHAAIAQVIRPEETPVTAEPRGTDT